MLQFRVAPNDEFILVQLEGIVSVEAWQQALSAVETHIASLPGDRLLFDLTGLLGWLGVPERTAVGAMMAAHFKRMKRVALVIQAAKITGVVQAEARRRGLDLKLFADSGEARNWVISS